MAPLAVNAWVRAHIVGALAARSDLWLILLKDSSSRSESPPETLE